MMTDVWTQSSYFPSSVYTLEKPEFLKDVSVVADEYLTERLKYYKDEDYPMVQTSSLIDDVRITTFSSYILNTCWNILNNEGYSMENRSVFFNEMWVQTYYKFSLMERHVHPGCNLIGFYFLETPENGCKPHFYDPRSIKEMSNYPPVLEDRVSNASRVIHFTPKPGMLMFAEAWLPHSFSSNFSDKPTKVVHFNVTVKDYVSPPQGAIVI